MMGIKQDALAQELGDDWNQKRVSLLEQKESIDPEILERIAKVLKVPAEAIKHFTEEGAVNIISSTFHDTSISNQNWYPTYNFNPLDKIIELYERIIKEQRELLNLFMPAKNHEA